MDFGKKNRLSRVIKPDGRCFFLPIDHGYFLGPTQNLEKPAETIAPLLPYCDALFVTRGVLRACVDPADPTPIILRISGGPSVVGKDLADESITTSIEEVIRLNASAVGISVFVGSDYEHQTLLNLAKTVDECEKYGIPVMAVTAVGKETEKRTARYLALSCRIAAEMGATVVKTYWCPDFEKVVFNDKVLDKEMIDIYYDYKKEQGYSEYEIAQKREALENVLIPFTIEENIQMCKDAGFTQIDTVFQWANFVTFIAKK